MPPISAFAAFGRFGASRAPLAGASSPPVAPEVQSVTLNDVVSPDPTDATIILTGGGDVAVFYADADAPPTTRAEAESTFASVPAAVKELLVGVTQSPLASWSGADLDTLQANDFAGQNVTLAAYMVGGSTFAIAPQSFAVPALAPNLLVTNGPGPLLTDADFNVTNVVTSDQGGGITRAAITSGATNANRAEFALSPNPGAGSYRVSLSLRIGTTASSGSNIIGAGIGARGNNSNRGYVYFNLQTGSLIGQGFSGGMSASNISIAPNGDFYDIQFDVTNTGATGFERFKIVLTATGNTGANGNNSGPITAGDYLELSGEILMTEVTS